MMKPQIYRIKDIGPGLLSVMAKPVAGEWLDEDFRFYKDSGISLIVSLLEDMEAFELGLQGEKEIAERHGIAFLSFPVADRGLPESFFGFKAFVSSLHHQIKGGAHAAVHCRAGIGRSGLTAAAVLLHEGFTPEDAFALISEVRRCPVPDTDEQRRWLIENRRDLFEREKISKF
ncbi:MAG: dual specificity protein phosphatase family protein [Alphaproteobacteria bacterium]|nr:dual specificity protein phosphatase family protein [Alphaproteobacteria bacterium]MCB9975086.1 dual specificity protein phosphatase family protein [Rhodospirillales bacterium]